MGKEEISAVVHDLQGQAHTRGQVRTVRVRDAMPLLTDREQVIGRTPRSCPSNPRLAEDGWTRGRPGLLATGPRASARVVAFALPSIPLPRLGRRRRTDVPCAWARGWPLAILVLHRRRSTSRPAVRRRRDAATVLMMLAACPG